VIEPRVPEPMKSNLAVLAAPALLFVPVSIASVPQGAESRPLKLLSKCLLRTGKPSVVRSHILEAMNLTGYPVRNLSERA
jgi:hypothetical protein